MCNELICVVQGRDFKLGDKFTYDIKSRDSVIIYKEERYFCDIPLTELKTHFKTIIQIREEKIKNILDV